MYPFNLYYKSHPDLVTDKGDASTTDTVDEVVASALPTPTPSDGDNNRTSASESEDEDLVAELKN